MGGWRLLRTHAVSLMPRLTMANYAAAGEDHTCCVPSYVKMACGKCSDIVELHMCCHISKAAVHTMPANILQAGII